jgi:hypothetical protein
VILRGYEERQGIWAEVDSIQNTPVTSEGNPLNEAKAVVFIPWYHIISIVHFPGKEKLEVDFKKSKKVGFRQA